jgi:hypothetical protein
VPTIHAADRHLRVALLGLMVGVWGCETEVADPLVGTWALESAMTEAPDGTIDNAPYGTAPTGFLTYTSDGQMHAIIAFSDRPRLSGDWRSSPAEERAEAFATSLAYSGGYSVVGDRVQHHVEVSTEPNRVGTTIERTFSISGDELLITTPPTSLGSTPMVVTLTWRRADPDRQGGAA